MQTDISATDEDIARAVQEGDADAFGTIVERYEPKLSRYARKFLTGYDDITDAIQDVFIKVYENIQSYDAKRPFSPWIYRIAHNELVNILRKRKRQPISLFDPDTIFPHPVAKETADGEVIREELSREMERDLEKLDEKYREPIVLYYYEDMDYKAIAEILRIPVSTVGVRIARGKKQLLAYRTQHEHD
ncbi:MAG: RNA polymerase sigma factor [Candidatus Yonathbacteria bacterium]|nr:RNA polymerase sigma factor [Candidatus Yonathbacteria bacterium]